jgi:outer membrane protein insertion porin family
VRKQLEGLGAFKNVNVFIDTSNGENASIDGLEVTYSVVENRRIVGGINTSVGNNNDGSLVLQLKLPNALGRGLTFISIYF